MNLKYWQSISTCFMATIRICKLSDFTKKSSPSRKCLALLCDGNFLFWLWWWWWCYGLSLGTLGNRHGTAAPLAMFVVWIRKPTVFVWSSTPPTTIYLGCFPSLLVVLNHKSGVWLTPPKTRHTWPPGTRHVWLILHFFLFWITRVAFCTTWD